MVCQISEISKKTNEAISVMHHTTYLSLKSLNKTWYMYNQLQQRGSWCLFILGYFIKPKTLSLVLRWELSRQQLTLKALVNEFKFFPFENVSR